MNFSSSIQSLDDGVFLKRHSKLELDEKRRKRYAMSSFRASFKRTRFLSRSFMLPLSFRWDIQRIREQRMFQRLQQRMNRQKVILESEPELLSFYPEAEDGMSSYI